MLKASRTPRAELRADFTYEVSEANAAGGTINETRLTLDLGGRGFNVAREGVIGPVFHLKSGETLIASAKRKPMFNNFKLSFGGKEWTFRATGLLANKFGLFEDDKQTGTVASGPFTHRFKDMTADLPAELPQEVRAFLL